MAASSALILALLSNPAPAAAASSQPVPADVDDQPALVVVPRPTVEPPPAPPSAPPAPPLMLLWPPSPRPVEAGSPSQGRALAGPVAGALTALCPLIIGSALWAQEDRPDRQRQGALVVLGGFAAAPWVAEGVSGRWRRALAYGLTSVAVASGAVIAMEAEDAFNPAIINRHRLPFGILLTTAFFTAAAGVVDSLVMASPAVPPASNGGDW